MRRAVFFWGLGGFALVATGTVVVWMRNRNKVDLSVFDSPDQVGSGQCMDKTFIKMLQEVAKLTGYPIFEWINSGARSPAWNQRVGGVSNSAHLIPNCKAADIKTNDTTIRDHIVAAAREVGFKRIGIGNTFVHLDHDESKKQFVAWGYPVGSPPPYNPFTT